MPKRSDLKKVLIMAGGTGGHVFPGLALAKELQKRGVSVEWLGTQAGIESRLIPEANIPLHLIPVKGVRGKSGLQKLQAPLNVISSVLSALKVIKRLKPDVVVGLGGFVAGPGGLAAKLLGLPLVIHEQNAVAGTTNRILSKMANKVLTAFPNVLAGSECIGNPVRREIESLPKPIERKQYQEMSNINLLVLGGSRGAQAINEMLPKAIAKLEGGERLNVWHQSGEQKHEATLRAYSEARVDARVDAFIGDMAEAYAWADLIVCRSGALTVSEIAAAGVGAIFIPYPYAIDDHQTANAQFLVDLGAAEVRQQAELNENELANLIGSYLKQPTLLQNMAMAAREFAKPNAAETFADRCEELMNG